MTTSSGGTPSPDPGLEYCISVKEKLSKYSTKTPGWVGATVSPSPDEDVDPSSYPDISCEVRILDKDRSVILSRTITHPSYNARLLIPTVKRGYLKDGFKSDFDNLFSLDSMVSATTSLLPFSTTSSYSSSSSSAPAYQLSGVVDMLLTFDFGVADIHRFSVFLCEKQLSSFKEGRSTVSSVSGGAPSDVGATLFIMSCNGKIRFFLRGLFNVFFL